MTIQSDAERVGGQNPLPADAPDPEAGSRNVRAFLVVTAIVAWLLGAAWWHLTQGIADVGARDIWAVLTGGNTGDQAVAVVVESRVPRLLAALVVGGALGASGAAMQAMARNPLASPDTTAVNAGAWLALTVVAALGVSTGALSGTLVAFVGGLAAASVVIILSSGPDASAIRLVLAGSVLTLGLSSITSVLLLLFPWETQGLFAWGAGSLGQVGLGAIQQVTPILLAALVALLALGRQLDLLQLGDDAARALGVNVTSLRLAAVLLAVLLAACAVTVAGPIGFVGLCAPVIVRLLAGQVRILRKHRVLIPVSAVAGVALLLSADVLMRVIFNPVRGVTIPAGVVTTILGAVFLIIIAQRMRVASAGDSLATLRGGMAFGRTHPRLIIAVTTGVLAAALVAGVLLGDRVVLLGDVWNWITGNASLSLEISLDRRVPRVTAAAMAGACLALAGALVQNVTRNPMADPSILGFSSSAGLGAVAVIVTMTAPTFTHLFLGGVCGVLVAALIVFGFAARDDMNPVRMVLVGVGTGAAATSLTSLLIIRTDPWNQNKAITWLGGSTYGVDFTHQIPMVVALVVGAVVLLRTSKDLDVMQIDDTTPRVLGVAVGPSRIGHIALALGLTAAATVSVGVIAFVGLVAPHAARIIVGKNHRTMVPLAMLLGALLVCVADVIGRVVIAPGQLPVGLVTAVIGTPYFLWLLWYLRDGR